MERAVDLPGAAHLVLADGVVHLEPARAVFEAMLTGWATQQRSRFLKATSTIKPRLDLIRRFAGYSNPQGVDHNRHACGAHPRPKP